MEQKSIKEINNEISLLGNKGNISDGSHTFEELYFTRCIGNINKQKNIIFTINMQLEVQNDKTNHHQRS
ncbi:hypothetical protein EK720_14915 [Listeria monocytogenes]|nr:hypothetical protein [Listeria monocytogenes]NBL43992.1 hypothetical protein [Listeria monocytogenes]